MRRSQLRLWIANDYEDQRLCHQTEVRNFSKLFPKDWIRRCMQSTLDSSWYIVGAKYILTNIKWNVIQACSLWNSKYTFDLEWFNSLFRINEYLNLKSSVIPLFARYSLDSSGSLWSTGWCTGSQEDSKVYFNVDKVLGSPNFWENYWEMLLGITRSSEPSKTLRTSHWLPLRRNLRLMRVLT